MMKKPIKVIEVTPLPTPETNESYRINATPDPNSPTGVYIPVNLEEVITELDKMLPVSLKLKLLEDSIGNYHFTLGLWLRNNWNLWENPPLVQNLVQMGASTHPDDLGNLLLRSYQQYLQNPFWDIENLEEGHIKLQERLKLLLNSDRATTWVLDDSHQQLWTKISISNKIQEIRIPKSAGFTGKVIDSRNTLNIPFDWYDHPENEEMNDKEMGSIKGNIYTKYRICSLLVMPIFNADEKIIGVVQLVNKIKPGQFPPYNPQNWPEAPECWQNSFTDNDEALLQKLNQQIAMLINRYLQQIPGE